MNGKYFHQIKIFLAIHARETLIQIAEKEKKSGQQKEFKNPKNSC